MAKVEDLKSKVEALSKLYNSVGIPEFTKSGSVVFDALLGGGIPKGVFILWSAENGCGKSTGALHISKSYCVQGKKVLYLDYEAGVNHAQLNTMGLLSYLYDPKTNPDGQFFMYQVQTYKDAERILDEIMPMVDLVVIDSMTAILTEKVKGASSEDVLPGQDSRVMSIFLKKYKAEAVRNGVTWIMINQMRTKIRFIGVTTDEEAGGNALKFYPDIRLQMKKAYKGVLERDEETATGKQKVPFGALCTIWAVKNRHARPHIPLSLAIIFGKGISNEYAYYDFLSSKNNIKKEGAWYTIKLGDVTDKMQGINKVITWIKEHKVEVRDYIKNNGGFKLLVDEASPLIELESGEHFQEDIYGEDVITNQFDGVSEETIEASRAELTGVGVGDEE